MEKAFPGHYNYYHLISGHDFLLKPIEKIQEFFDNCSGKEFLAVNYHYMNKKSIIERLDLYHLAMKNRDRTQRVNRILVKIQHIFRIHRLKKSKILNYLSKGPNWASMTHSFISCLLDSQDEIMKITHYALCADELYKQIIFNEHKDSFVLYRNIPAPETTTLPECVLEANATMHYVDWLRGEPYVFHNEDYAELISSPYMFARKFNPEIDKKIIDRLFAFVTQNKNR